MLVGHNFSGPKTTTKLVLSSTLPFAVLCILEDNISALTLYLVWRAALGHLSVPE